MSYQPSPSGLRPLKHKAGGQVRPSDAEVTIASGYATTIGFGDPVTLVAGSVTISDGTAFDAVFRGVEGLFVDGTPFIMDYWPANQAVEQIDALYILDDPHIEYSVIADGAIASNPIGKLANLNIVAPLAENGVSQVTLNTASLGTTGTAVKVVGVKGDPTLANPELRVINAKASPASAR